MIADSNPVSNLICIALTVYSILLLVRVVLSWLELAGVRPPATGPVRSGFELLIGKETAVSLRIQGHWVERPVLTGARQRPLQVLEGSLFSTNVVEQASKL